MTASSPQFLLCHPTGQCTAIRHIEVAAGFLDSGDLCLSFVVDGAMADLVFPDPQPSAPADGLWQHTCCEAFIAAVDQPEYREFNFSPSGQWAAYAFKDYRERDSAFVPAIGPNIVVSRQDGHLRLEAMLAPALLPPGQAFALALTMVVEASDGSKTYWALKHAAAQPDFHLRQSFALILNEKTA